MMLRFDPILSGGGGGGGVAPFSPLDLPSLERWFDASDASSITEVSGAVSNWADKSGNGYDVSQATAGRRPVVSSAAINSLDAIDFDGSLTALYEASAAGIPSGDDQAFSIFIVLHADATGDLHCGFGRSSTGGPYIRCINSGSTNWSLDKRDDSLTSKKPGGSTSIDTTSAHLLAYLCDGTTLDIRLDGASEVSGGDLDVGTTTLDQFTIGANREGGSYSFPFDGRVAEVVHCSAEITGDDLTAVEAYLMDKWGIA